MINEKNFMKVCLRADEVKSLRNKIRLERASKYLADRNE